MYVRKYMFLMYVQADPSIKSFPLRFLSYEYPRSNPHLSSFNDLHLIHNAKKFLQVRELDKYYKQ